MHFHSTIKQNFLDNIQTQQMAVDMLSGAIESAARMITDSFLAGGKILACGEGAAALLAHQFCHTMLDCHHTPRPALPALSLNHVASAHNLCDNAEGHYARTLGALGESHDILLTISIDGDDTSIVDAIHTAQERGLAVLALTGMSGGRVADCLQAHDIEIRAPSDNRGRILETQFLVVNCLCELIDRQLLGQ